MKDIIQLKVDKILLGINALNVIKKRNKENLGYYDNYIVNEEECYA